MTIDELLSIAGLTANDEIPVWDAEATGEPTRKITAQQLAAAVVALASLVTGVKGNAEGAYRHGDVNITPANIGALPISGGTLTGALKTLGGNMQIGGGTWQFLHFLNSNEKKVGSVRGDENLGNRVVFREQTPNMNDDNACEDYKLPNPTADHLEPYDILTSKSPVTVPQGGTGATTPEQARTNLGITPANIGAMSRSPVSIYGSDSESLSNDIQNAVFNIPVYTGTLVYFYYAGSSDNVLTYGATYSGIIHRISEDGYYFTGSFTNNAGQMIIIYRSGSDGLVSYKRVI